MENYLLYLNAILIYKQNYDSIFLKNIIKNNKFLSEKKYLINMIVTLLKKNKKILFYMVNNHPLYYLTPTNINYAWSFGSFVDLFFSLFILAFLGNANFFTKNPVYVKHI